MKLEIIYMDDKRDSIECNDVYVDKGGVLFPMRRHGDQWESICGFPLCNIRKYRMIVEDNDGTARV